MFISLRLLYACVVSHSLVESYFRVLKVHVFVFLEPVTLHIQYDTNVLREKEEGKCFQERVAFFCIIVNFAYSLLL